VALHFATDIRRQPKKCSKNRAHPSQGRSRLFKLGIERAINGLASDERLAVRHDKSMPLLTDLEAWLREQRSKLSRSSSVAKPIDDMLKRWSDFARFAEDGRICLTNNAAERALRGLALGRRAWLFAGSDRGADRAAVISTLIMTAKLNDVDPQAWLADVFARIAGLPQSRLHELLPWEWQCRTAANSAGALAA
jgi:transposase